MKKCNKEISISFITDKGYLLPTHVSLKSLIINSNRHYKYKIHIFHTNLTNQDLDVIKKLEKTNIKIIFHFVDTTNLFPGIDHEITGKNVTKTALIKFYLSDILKIENKTLYIDGDTLILNDLINLFFTDIRDYYCAACRDVPWVLRGDKKINEIKFGYDYFNSGVLLLNLEKLRVESIAKKLLFSKKIINTNLMDQDAFNYVFFKKVKFLQQDYNIMIDAIYRHILNGKTSIDSINNKIKSNYKNFDSILESSKVIHFGSYYKPWNFYDIICADIWHAYYLKEPKFNILLDRKTRVRFDK